MLSNNDLQQQYSWSNKRQSSRNKKYQHGLQNNVVKLIRVIYQKLKVDRTSIREKLSVHNDIKNDYLVKLRAIRSQTEQKIIDIFYDYFPGTTLKIYFTRHKLTNECIRNIIVQVVIAMCQLQKKGRCHLRLNHQCIIIDQKGHLKITDFGPCKQQNQNDMDQNSSMYRFLHPKIILDRKNPYNNYLSIYDIWSFGIIIYELVYKKNPFNDKDRQFSAKKLNQFLETGLTLPADQHKNLLPLVSQLLPRMLSVPQTKNGFTQWSQIKNFFQENLLVSSLSFVAIDEICIQHIRLIFLYSKVYVMINFESMLNFEGFWKLHKQTLQSLAINLVCMCEKFRIIFQSRFKHLFNEISEQIKIKLAFVHNRLKIQIENLQNKDFYPESKKQQNFYALIEDTKELCIQLMTRFQAPYLAPVLILKQFCGAFNQMCLSINKIYLRCLQVPYSSQKYKNIAKNYFNFSFP